jgi:all-trans-retinol 13,14-reductase
MLDSVRKEIMSGFISLKAMPQWMASLFAATGLINYFSKYFTYASKSVTEVLTELTPNPTLRAVLAYNFGDYGTMPKDAPFTMHATLQSHFLNGVSYPVGGASEIAYNIVPTIRRAGGEVFVRAEVDEILLDDRKNKAIGVRLTRGQREIRAPIVISAAGLYNTYNKLLPPRALPSLAPMVNNVQHGHGGISVYVGLKGTNEENKLSGKHFWVFWTKKGAEDLDAVTQKYLDRPAEKAFDAPVPLLFVSFPSAKDPLWDQKCPGKSSATIVTVGNFDWFKQWDHKKTQHRGKDYDALKTQLGELIWKQTLSLFPHLADKVEYFDVGTPVTNNYYIGASAGEMYGADHNKVGC